MAIKSGTKKPTKVNKSVTNQENPVDTDDLAQNLRLLKAILDAPTNSSGVSSQPRRPKTPLATAPRQNGKITRTNKAKSKDGKTSVVNTKEEPTLKPPLSAGDQKKLAMNCFNRSLKSLAVIARHRQTDRPGKLGKGHMREASSTDDEKQKPAEILEYVSEDSNADAECACAALAVLRLHDHQEPSSDEASYKREQGAILLLDKLITLGLKDLAYAEASRIHEQYWKRRKSSPANYTSRRGTKKIDLAVLICGDHEALDKRDFETIISFQSQLLRLAILTGPTAVNDNLVQAVRVKVSGSPADMIVSAQKKDFMTAKLAGESLSIVSQALSKISSTIGRPAQNSGGEKDFLAVDLLMEAQLMKLVSWQLSGHEPDLPRELWTPVERGVRNLWSKRRQDDSERYSFTTSLLGRLQVELRAVPLRSELPDKLDLLLCQLAESNGDHKTATESLERLAIIANGMEKLSCLCRISAILLQTHPTQNQTAKYIEEVTKLLAENMMHNATLKADDLVSVVRLRKACFEKLSMPLADEPGEGQQAIHPICLRVLSMTCQFCYFFCRQKELDDKLRRSINLATLKTIENLVDVEKCATSAQSSLFLEYLNSLEDCLRIVSENPESNIITLQEGFGSSVLDALKIRISNVFWRSHLHSSVTQAPEISAVRLARISVACLDGLPVEELRKAALGPRLEKLSGMCVQAGESIEARGHIEAAIKHYILTDALSDAVEASLSKRSGDVWIDAASLASQLGRALQAHNSISMKEAKNTILADCIYDSESLSTIHRAVLLEHQILYVLGKYTDALTYRTLHELVHKVVGLANLPQHHVWALRFVSKIVFRASKIANLGTEDTSQLLELASSMLRVNTPDSNDLLERYHTTIKVQLELQRALLAEPSEQDSLRDDLGKLLEKVRSCSTPDALDTVVDDYDSFRSVIRAYTDQVLALQDYEAAVICLKICICAGEHSNEPGEKTLNDWYIDLTISQIRLDDTKSAGQSLAQAEKLLKAVTDNTSQTTRFHLASAEYYLAISELTKCKTSLLNAGSAFVKLWPPDTNLSSVKQIERDAMVAKGAMLASVLAFRHGDSLLANQHARQATKISVSIWSALEKRIPDTAAVFNNDTTVASLTDNMSKLDIESEKKSMTFRTVGPKYWPYLDMYIRSIKHLAFILSHSGLCEDALQYFKQLKHLASSMLSSRISLDPAPALSLLFAKAGRAQEAMKLIVDSTLDFDKQKNQPGLTDAILSYCEAYIVQGNLPQAKALLSKVPVKIDKMIEDPIPNIEVKSVKPVSKARRGIGKPEVIKAPPKRQNSSSNPKAKKVTSTTIQTRTNSHLSFDQILNDSRRKAVILACREDCAGTASTNQQDFDVPSQLEMPPNLVNELYQEAKRMLSEAWKKLSADGFASVLTESAMALPSRTKSTAQRAVRVSFLQGGGDSTSTDSTQGSRSPGSGLSDMQAMSHTLQSALRICKTLLEERQQYCPTDMINSLVKMEARISLLLASMNLPFVISSTDLVLKASQPKDCALERERIVSLAEQATQDRSSLSTWPNNFSSDSTSSTSSVKKQLNDLPASWSIISLALAEDDDELLLSKTVAGSDPFLVRIPLRRSNEGNTADEFVFEDAMNEMKEIIEAANSSSHDTRGTLDKVTRTQWHGDREVLDQKLASLLENIETIWLGGFRGILSPYIFESKRVKQFGRCLTQSLDRNLPSRQKNSMVEERVQIHEHILEIFLGLGNPDENDLDDSVMDLLYFVVDILQFNGERNAYDEIDWDVILIDILDALRKYYNSIGEQQPRHTILILDKELETFPWEALPCLIDHPVSRMPSLGSVFDRLTQIRASSTKDHSAYTINKSQARGTIVLNPAGDLTSTQDFFEPILIDNVSSQNYTSLINSPPTESQFSSLLIKSDIFLYIGHGSGAQYIRPRTIRALPSCAVTFLFGCSSSKMTTHGAFESTGMPRAYMLGHAPAVVGCLWDVTDKEIDRVALQTMVSWGLICGKDKRVQDGLKKRGRRKVGERSAGVGVDKRGGMGKTLIEAVREGREASVLRFLCGAAVVVYGVPVVLE